jgi:osmotically-inducible protein OsmY
MRCSRRIEIALTKPGHLTLDGRKARALWIAGLATAWNRVWLFSCPNGMLYQGENMKSLKPCMSLLAVVVIGTLAGCATNTTRSANVSGGIRTSLDQAGLKDVSVTENHDKGVVTLGGHVAADPDKAQAESIATSMAGGQVVSNQIAVIPPGTAHDAKKMNSDLDKGIEGNLDAALLQNSLHKNVNYAVNNQVVTLSGEVDSQSKRAQAQTIATTVPNVLQVVNELQVKDQKATSSN